MFDANCALILHQEYHYRQTDQTELPLEPRHLGVPSSASKMISMPMVCSLQTMHLSCTDTNTVSKWTKTIFHMTHITTSSIGCVQNYLCTYLVSRLALSPNGPNRAPLDPHHLGEPSSASKTIYEPMVRLTQTEHLSCTDANSVSK
jgi:hypothetical protein